MDEKMKITGYERERRNADRWRDGEIGRWGGFKSLGPSNPRILIFSLFLLRYVKIPPSTRPIMDMLMISDA